MKRLIAFAVIATALVLQLAPAPVRAATVDDCLAQISALNAATAAATFRDDEQGAKIREQLLGHLEKASAELTKGDVRGAWQQMRNYIRNLEDAIESGRLTSDPAGLVAGADAAVACIESLF